jgi:hypothetical protein
MSLDELVAKGWQDHADDAEGVFARLRENVGLVTEARHLPPFAGLAVHVSGEHLGRWADGIALLERLGRSPVFDAGSPEGKAVARGLATLHRCAGNREASERCLTAARSGGTVPDASDRARVLAVAASALAGQRRIGDATAAFEEALRAAAYGPKADDPAAKALAITGNNLAADLENRTSRTEEENALMVRAAETGLRFWSLVGGWSERQGAHYRLSHSLRKAGRPKEALEHARRCLDIVRENGAPAADAFFAHEALAHAHASAGDRAAAKADRETAAALLSRIDDSDLRSSAETDLRALDAVLAR